MRNIIMVIFGLIILAPLAALSWLYFDSSELPELQQLAAFAPTVPTKLTDPCLRTTEPVVAIPYESIGKNMHAALSAAEAGEDGPGFFESMYLYLTRDIRAIPKRQLVPLVEITTLCARLPSRTINHHLDSLHLSVQLDFYYTRRQLFTMLANRIYLGEGQYGIEAAAQHYFHKEPSQLSIAEAALVVGIAKQPVYYSPRLHPDHALQRRNQVIDEMIAVGSISNSDGTSAKAAAMPVFPDARH